MDILVNNKQPYSYIVSLTYHKIGDDTYEVLEENTIDLRYHLPFEDVKEDISCYQSEWISSTNEYCNLEYDVIYYSVLAVTTSYHKDYWGEVDQDVDCEVLSHIQLDCSVDDFIEFRGLVPPVETFSGTGPIIF